MSGLTVNPSLLEPTATVSSQSSTALVAPSLITTVSSYVVITITSTSTGPRLPTTTGSSHSTATKEVGEYAGIAVGGTVWLLIVITTLVCFIRLQRRKAQRRARECRTNTSAGGAAHLLSPSGSERAGSPVTTNASMPQQPASLRVGARSVILVLGRTQPGVSDGPSAPQWRTRSGTLVPADRSGTEAAAAEQTAPSLARLRLDSAPPRTPSPADELVTAYSPTLGGSIAASRRGGCAHDFADIPEPPPPAPYVGPRASTPDADAGLPGPGCALCGGDGDDDDDAESESEPPSPLGHRMTNHVDSGLRFGAQTAPSIVDLASPVAEKGEMPPAYTAD